MREQKQRRLPVVIASIAIQLCLGTVYIWSVFQNGIAQGIFSGRNADAALTFSLLLAVLGFGSIAGGRLQEVIGPRATVITGGVIAGIGFIAASFTSASFPWLLWLTYGVLGGFGMGFSYSTTITIAQKWYPEKKGLITGIIVSALGFGGVVFTPIVGAVIAHFDTGVAGSGELMALRVLGIIFIVVSLIGGYFIAAPPEDVLHGAVSGSGQGESLSPRQIMKDPRFYLLAGSLMLACMGGLMMIGFAKPIAIARGMAKTATVGVLAITLFNSIGRLFWGFISDKLGRKRTVILLLVVTAVLSLCVNLVTGYMIYVLIALIGFSYGGFLGTYPSFTSDLFGVKYNATNYGMVLIGFAVGALASSYIAGYFKDIAATDINLMFPAFIIASAAALLSILLVALIKTKNV
ncbi:OFA family MFS transporter [Parasporobacterium paucivorans]|uniref:MFS transporter, OFA family, oxalate/formate antiporter n=1 Tax=Parasporobacterium paucivorans DSM 15970 TaxID=1122934 RepID=A0A1M6JIV3_9FIRM|nr:OFA family MFS transporter [Parasporobacterium paucivorans]SHJ46624.1 MFS transporter, OFA family, oxalate/formate antiporter [Parasporobacterium paucivorans DSM 15970]